MSKTAYHLQLKGFVGGADFDRKAVDNILEKNQGKQVNVLIDSTGGNLANYFDYKRLADGLFIKAYQMGSNGHVFLKH